MDGVFLHRRAPVRRRRSGSSPVSVVIVVPAGVNVHLALGHTDMRKGLDGLATLIQEHLKKDPVSGHLFVFTKRIDHGSFWSPRDRAWRLGDAVPGAARDPDRRRPGCSPK